MQLNDIDITVQCRSAADIECDVLALKYAQGFHGADQYIAERLPLKTHNICPQPGDFLVVPNGGKVAARKIMFLGVTSLRRFDYLGIHEFALNTLKILAREAPETEHLVMTMHGVNFGLDERESFRSQISGIELALRQSIQPKKLRKITIVEWNERRAKRLQMLLTSYLIAHTTSPTNNKPDPQTAPPTTAQITSSVMQATSKPHVFVAMPFCDEMEDVFIFGIQGPVNATGLLCERVDMATFTGDILDRIKSRIATADLVIADLSGANPNVYLEVGYAWGMNRPTLLIMKQGEELKFDVSHHRCIFYKTIADLKNKIEADLLHLAAQPTT